MRLFRVSFTPVVAVMLALGAATSGYATLTAGVRAEPTPPVTLTAPMTAPASPVTPQDPPAATQDPWIRRWRKP